MSSAGFVPKLNALLKKLKAPSDRPWPDAATPLDVLVQSFLIWESTTEKAVNAFQKLLANVVDYNELRVTMPLEIEAIIGTRYPKVTERSERLRATLRDVYLREHAMSLTRLEPLGKREIKKYIESLDGIVPYVSARVGLLCYDIHAIPVDDQLRTALTKSGAADPEADIETLASWLTRQIKATEAVAAHESMQAWVETTGKRGASSRSTKPLKRRTASQNGGKSARTKAGSR